MRKFFLCWGILTTSRKGNVIFNLISSIIILQVIFVIILVFLVICLCVFWQGVNWGKLSTTLPLFVWFFGLILFARSLVWIKFSWSSSRFLVHQSFLEQEFVYFLHIAQIIRHWIPEFCYHFRDHNNLDFLQKCHLLLKWLHLD